MNKILSISILSLASLIVTQASLAKKFIYDDQTGTYAEIRDDRNYSYNDYNRPLTSDNRYIYNGNQRIDRSMPKPSWDWKVGQDLPAQFRTKQFEVKSNDSPRIYDVASDEQWYRINGDYVLTDDDYEILRIIN